MTPLERVTKRISRVGDPNDPDSPRPLLSVGEFFDGNDHVGSFGCNLPDATPAQFQELFEQIAKRPDVRDIRVRISAFDDPGWPFADTVYVITTAGVDAVASWFPKQLAPDDVWEGFNEGELTEPYELPTGFHAVACWWD
jgi:hypothetical protein